MTASAALDRQLALLEQAFPARRVALPSGAVAGVRECGRRGNGPSLVLLHGISSGAASWLQPALLAGEQAHVVAWDAPGYGDSTPLPAGSESDEDYAGRLNELLQAMELYRCVLVGHSLGALMACAAARGRAAARIARVVLISPAGGYGARPADAQRVRSERRQALQEQGVQGLAERIPNRLLSAGADAAARAWVQWNTARLQPAGYLQAVELLAGSDIASGGPPVQPVEVHCGELDVVTTPASCRAIAPRLGASFQVIADAGHASPIEQPAAVARILLAAAGIA